MSSSVKRGRKKQNVVENIINDENTPIVEPAEMTPPVKKAGRKKKVPESVPEENCAEPTESTPDPNPPKKQRAKKTPQVVAVVGPSGIMGSFLSEQRPLIAHIPVTTEQIEFETAPEMMKYDPTVPDIPKPYDQGHDEFSYLDGVK
jgi:hypothetical protein